MSISKAKTGGRVAGTPNKRTLEALEVFGDFCPLEAIIHRLKRPGISDELYLQTCTKLLEYKFPKRRAVEVTSDFSDATNEQLLEELRQTYKSMTGEEL